MTKTSLDTFQHLGYVQISMNKNIIIYVENIVERTGKNNWGFENGYRLLKDIDFDKHYIFFLYLI